MGGRWNNTSFNYPISYDSAASSNVLTTSTTYSIPSAVYNHTLLYLMLRRWGHVGGTLIQIALLKSDASQALRICASGGRYWDVNISKAGIISLSELGGGAGEPYITVYGLF